MSIMAYKKLIKIQVVKLKKILFEGKGEFICQKYAQTVVMS